MQRLSAGLSNNVEHNGHFGREQKCSYFKMTDVSQVKYMGVVCGGSHHTQRLGSRMSSVIWCSTKGERYFSQSSANQLEVVASSSKRIAVARMCMRTGEVSYNPLGILKNIFL